MPELPEVETIKRDLETKILRQQIKAVTIYDGRVIRAPEEPDFVRRCLGCKISAVSRRGKAIILHLSPKGFLVVQPMMTGQIIFVKDSGKNSVSKHAKLTFLLSNGGCLNYNDQRLFGRLTIVDDLKELKFLQTIGPEPLDQTFNPQFITHIFKTRQAPIKSLLMNQQMVAGIGNIYASEILFVSQIDPQRAAKTLKGAEIKRLHKATIEVLEEAICYRGTSMRDYRDADGKKGNFIDRIKVYGREDEACLVCRTPIVKIVQAGRSTFYCRKCQK